MNDFLLKPIGRLDLRAMLAQWLTPRAEEADDTERADPQFAGLPSGRQRRRRSPR